LVTGNGKDEDRQAEKKISATIKICSAKEIFMKQLSVDTTKRKTFAFLITTLSGSIIGLGKGEKSATFTPDLPKAGLYEARMSHNSNIRRANGVPVTIRHAAAKPLCR